jgi:predicted double-glycine peptidase
MSNLTKILVFIIFFAILTVFTGTATASNCNLNPEDPIQLVINNTPHNDTIRNDITNNSVSDELMVNTTGIVMSNATSNCGPASLATVLQNLSINVSQNVLASDAGTDDNGTTMYGLAQAAQKQELIVKELKLKVNELQAWNLVYLTLDNIGHYSIVTNINNTIVYLADSDSGNINMTLADFTESYVQNKTSEYGYVLVITNNSSDPQLGNNNTLTDDEMKSIKGTGSIINEWNNGWKNPRIKSIVKSILFKFSGSWKIYGLGIWEWMIHNIHYHKHLNTLHSIDEVLNSHNANCCEMARLVVCLARAMGISAPNVRYVHKIARTYKGYGYMPGHVWAQIKWGPGTLDWIDLDCTLLFYIPGDDARHYGGAMDLNGRFDGPWKYRKYSYTLNF